ncbi:MAG: hypothetical protein NNA22_10635 [Nitrospira sp.]|nr:hypothetical protein [Nitrospira sp.]
MKKATAKTPAIVDPSGMIDVLHEEEEVRKTPEKQAPLVIRANVYDCVDVIFKNEIPDDARTGWANKIDLHPHFFRFDTSASDGPTIGFSYDRSLRVFTMLKDPAPNEGIPLPANTVLTADVKAGASSITVADPSKLFVSGIHGDVSAHHPSGDRRAVWSGHSGRGRTAKNGRRLFVLQRESLPLLGGKLGESSACTMNFRKTRNHCRDEIPRPSFRPSVKK